MPNCCVPGCFNTERTKPLRSFHRFPSDHKKRNDWIKFFQINKENTSNLRICSDHFMQSDFYITKSLKSCKRLKKTANPVYVLENKENINTVFDSQPPCALSLHLADVEHSYYTDVPTLKRNYEESMIKLSKKNNEIANLKRRCSRSSKKISDLRRELKNTKKLCDDTHKLLEAYGEIPVELFKKPTKEYTSEQVQFASTLHFYGPKAYEFLREKIHLPHPSSIRRWMMNINSCPGFSMQAIEHLKNKQVEDLNNYDKCSLILDAMSIKKHIEWDSRQQKMVGFVDFGVGSNDSDIENNEATEALVIMAVGLKNYWKIPVTYFFNSWH